MAKEVATEDAKSKTQNKLMDLTKLSASKHMTTEDQLAEQRRILVTENIFAQDKFEQKQGARLRVEAENEVERFIDWLELNRTRITYEDKYSSKIPLELQFRDTLVKTSKEITPGEIKRMREKRQDLIEEWAYDDTKILMVQCAYRAKKGKLHAHMVRQGKRAKRDWGIQEREEAEERRRALMLDKVIHDEEQALDLLEKTKMELESEHIDKVLDELRAGGKWWVSVLLGVVGVTDVSFFFALCG